MSHNCTMDHVRYRHVNLLKTYHTHNLLHIRNQSVPHSKHFPPRL